MAGNFVEKLGIAKYQLWTVALILVFKEKSLNSDYSKQV